jgi:hypothetical protein
MIGGEGRLVGEMDISQRCDGCPALLPSSLIVAKVSLLSNSCESSHSQNGFKVRKGS